MHVRCDTLPAIVIEKAVSEISHVEIKARGAVPECCTARAPALLLSHQTCATKMPTGFTTQLGAQCCMEVAAGWERYFVVTHVTTWCMVLPGSFCRLGE